MRIAIIDLGTNTFHLLIAERKEGNTFKIFFKAKSSVRLGEKGILKGYIAEDATRRAIRTLERFKKQVDLCEVSEVYVYGTSALRDAANKNEFSAHVLKKTGFAINIIDGNREAELITSGVNNALDIGTEPALIMDIGGGSVEFIIANRENIYWKASYDIGVARILATMPHSNPITLNEIAALNNYLSSKLEAVIAECNRYKVSTLIGSSGSFDTFAEMILWKKHTPKALQGKTEYTILLNDFEEVYTQIISSTIEERRHTKGLLAMRVEMIVLAAILTKWVIQNTGIEKMRLSTYALKEGALAELLEAKLI